MEHWSRGLLGAGVNSAAFIKSVVQDFKEKLTWCFVTGRLVGGTVTELYKVLPTEGASSARASERAG